MRRQQGHDTRPHARLPPNFLGMDDLTTKHSLDLQFGSLVYLVNICYPWQTFGQLVQELTTCTLDYGKIPNSWSVGYFELEIPVLHHELSILKEPSLPDKHFGTKYESLFGLK